MRRLPGLAENRPGDGGNSRGSLRNVSGLAVNTNSIFCDGPRGLRQQMDVRFCTGCRNHQPRGIRAQRQVLIGRTTRSQEQLLTPPLPATMYPCPLLFLKATLFAIVVFTEVESFHGFSARTTDSCFFLDRRPTWMPVNRPSDETDLLFLRTGAPRKDRCEGRRSDAASNTEGDFVSGQPIPQPEMLAPGRDVLALAVDESGLCSGPAAHTCHGEKGQTRKESGPQGEPHS
jgi:hypothetical protein